MNKLYLYEDIVNKNDYAWTTLGIDQDIYDMKWETIEENFSLKIWRVQRLMYEFILRNKFTQTNEKFAELGIPSIVFSRIHEFLYSCRNIVWHQWRAKCIVGLNANVYVPPHVNLFRFSFLKLLKT